MQVTIVFQKIWQALNARTETGARKYRYIVLRGSSRSSKTRSLLQAYYLYAFQHSKKRLSVWRDVAKDCRDTVGYDMNQAYPDHEGWGLVKFHSTKFTYTFPTNSVIEITGTDDPKKVHGYQGDVIWLNEPYDISRPTFDQLDMRTSDVVFIDYNPKEKHWVEDVMKDPRTIVIDSTFRDNPFCPDEQRRKILSYQPVGRCAVVVEKMLSQEKGANHEELARRYDTVNNPANLPIKALKELIRCRENEAKNTADDFNWLVYGLGQKGEKPHRIFRWREISDEDYHAIEAPVYYGVDWGTVDPWGILEVKYYDGTLYLRELNYTCENDIRAKLSSTERAQLSGDEEGIVTWLFRKLGIDPDRDIICDNNRPQKIKALRAAGYQAHKASKLANSIIDGVDLLNDLTVCYTASSTNLSYEQENYCRKTDRAGVLEEPEDMNNHLIDPARYVALYLKRLGVISKL